MCEKNSNQLPLSRSQLGTWPANRARALTGNRTGNLSVCRPALKPLSHTSQGFNFLSILPNYFSKRLNTVLRSPAMN